MVQAQIDKPSTTDAAAGNQAGLVPISDWSEGWQAQPTGAGRSAKPSDIAARESALFSPHSGGLSGTTDIFASRTQNPTELTKVANSQSAADLAKSPKTQSPTDVTKSPNTNNPAEVTKSGLTNISQGSLNDCYVPASLNDIIAHNGGPEQLKSMISPAAGTTWSGNMKDGKPDLADPRGHYDKYDVKFPGAKESIAVNWDEVDYRGNPQTADSSGGGRGSADLPVQSAADPKIQEKISGEQRAWPAIIEAAAGKYAHEHGLSSNAKANPQNPASYLEYMGGGPSFILPLLTNKKVDAVSTYSGLSLAENNRQVAENNAAATDRSWTGPLARAAEGATQDYRQLTGQGDQQRRQSAEKLSNEIESALNKGEDIVAGRKGEHAYSLEAVTHDGDKTYIVLRNPWNNQASEPGFKDSRAFDVDGKAFTQTENGLLKVTPREFQDKFEQIYVTK